MFLYIIVIIITIIIIKFIEFRKQTILRFFDRRNSRYFYFFLRHGFCQSEVWNIDHGCIRWILPKLKHYRDIGFSHPIGLTPEEWDDHLTNMILWMENKVDFYPEFETEVAKKKAEEGRRLFFQYFEDLWW